MKQILLFFFSIVAFALNAQVISLTTSTGPRGFNVDEIRVVRTAADSSAIISYGNPLVTFFVTQTPAQIVTASCNKLFSVIAVENVNGVSTNVPLVVNRMLIGNIQANLAGFAVITYKTPPAINIVTNQSYVTVAALADDCSGGTGGSLDSYVLDTVTQTAHGFRVMDAVLDTSSTSTSKFIKGNTSNQNRLPSHLVVDSLSANLFVVQRAGYVKKIQTRYTARQVYYLRDDGSYASTPDSTYNFPVFAITSSTTPIYLTPIVAGSGGGAGTPGGSNTQVQFNNAGAFGGASTFTWNGTTLSAPALSLTGIGNAANFRQGYTTTATAAGTTTLTAASNYLQFFTGGTTQTLVLPVVSTLTLGHQYYIRNNSTGSVTVQASGGNGVIILGPNTRCIVTCILTSGTDASSWSAMYMGLNVASGKVLAVSNSLTLSGTDGSTINAGAGGNIAYQNQVNTFTQNQANSFTSIASTPANQFTGTWFTGGTSTTTKPHVLIEPAGAASTNWSTAGTGLGVNAASGFAGNLLDLQVNGAARFSVLSSGNVSTSGNISSTGVITAGTNLFLGGGNFFRFSSSTALNAPSDGRLQLNNNAINDFERLQFGGTTSSFPALQTASSNAQTGLAATFVNGSSTITTATNAYAVNQVVQFTTTGTLPTGFAINTNYFIVGSPTATTIEVSATQGGTAITAGSAGSGTHTVVRQTSATIPNGSSTWTSTFAHGLRVGDVIRFSGTALPTNFSSFADYYVLTIPSITTFTVATTLGGTVISAGSAVGTTIVFTRNPGIYFRTADNTSSIQIYTNSIIANDVSAVGFVRGNELNYNTRVYNTNSGGTMLSPVQTQHTLTNIAQNDYSRLNFGTNTNTGAGLQTATFSAIAVTFVNASANITGTFPRIFSAGDIVVFTNSGGALPTSITTNTEYYVVGTPNATTIQVATTFGGTAIVHDGAGTGTHTVTRAAAIYTRNGNNSAYIPIATGKHSFDATNTPAATLGAQTINKPSGTVNFAAAATSLVVTNSLVSTSSIVYAVVRTNDTTAVIKNVVPANGSFTINLNAAATAETSVGFVVFN